MTKIVRVSLEHPLAEWAEKEEQVPGPEGARVGGGGFGGSAQNPGSRGKAVSRRRSDHLGLGWQVDQVG